MPAQGSLIALQLSSGGVPKVGVAEAWLGRLGFERDDHDDKRNHGGPERAVSLWALEIIETLAAEGHPLAPGAAGENVTLSGLAWDALVPGVTLALGPNAVVQISSYCTPCKTIAHCFHDGDFMRISHRVRPELSRLYARVLCEGRVTRGDAVVLR
jgi:MOSC domain-containing protein YiiM